MTRKIAPKSTKSDKTAENVSSDVLGFLVTISLFMVLSLLFYQHFLFWSGDMVGVQEPGMLSIIPAYNVDAIFQEDFKEGESLQVTLNLCSSFESECIPCPNCGADLYYDYGEGKQLYEKDIQITNGTALIQIRTIPTWLYVEFNGTYYNFLRIPDPSLFDYIVESAKNTTNLLTFFVTWSWLITAGFTIITAIKLIVGKIKKYKEGRKKPDYIG